MPVRQLRPPPPPNQAELIDRLAAEWKSPDPAALEPVILEEKNSKGQVVHVYVVWDDWSHIDQIQRSEIIMDAADRIKPLPEVIVITVAMGLTTTEADRYGIKWR